ncbi:MAG: acetate--CoA ligase [Dissulfurimicrobium sp.]|uniref:acetate--CoA ligase n=1 Tax=Dissulfurimicrobium sp. TaxID=2022436 RepID=UPI00404A3EF6
MADKTKDIESLMHEKRVFKHSRKDAWINDIQEYEAIYRHSMEDLEGFWAKRAEELIHWDRKWDKVLDYDFFKPEISWFVGGKLNVSYNCLDRHLIDGRRNKAAIIWQGEPEDDVKVYTYQMLHREVCRFANVLKKRGVQKGDRVAIYLPMIPEIVIAMLACARIGAIHSIVFAGFSAASLMSRIKDCQPKVVITSDGALRNGRMIALKKHVDEALGQFQCCPFVQSCIVVKRTGCDVTMKIGRDRWWHDEMEGEDITDNCEPVSMDSEDMLFILYTSGSTGKPKGVIHTTGGYITYVASTTQWVFDLKDDDVYWCTADVGWITGHSYIVYGPLALGGTSLMFEGVPNWPKPDRFWHIIEKFKVNTFYTAPTVIRMLMREDVEWVKKHDLSSLKLLGSVGEPINPEAWMWYHKNIGQGRIPIVDTWWQTETGGILISPLPFATPLKPGSATLPLPGIEPAVVRADGTPVDVNEGGNLVIKRPWPGMLRGVFGAPERFKSQYFEQFPGMYESGDGARCDEDGYFWIMGRIDDVINVSGHRLGTAEIESALVAHPVVAEAAVVGMPHDIKGQAIYAYVTLKAGIQGSDSLRKELRDHVRENIGPIATPEVIQFTERLPKTRSGKIMRRILRKIAAGEIGDLGDTSTLADPAVVDDLIKGKEELFKAR